MIHKATKKQIKPLYCTDTSRNQITKEMESNLEQIENIFKNCGLSILGTPAGMFYTGFTWKLSWSNDKIFLIFDILYSDDRFSIYVYNVLHCSKDEVSNYFDSNLKTFHLRRFTHHTNVKDLESVLTKFLHLFALE